MEPNLVIIPPAPVSQSTQQSPVPTKKYKYLKGLLFFMVCELLIAGGIALYFWRDGQAIDQHSADVKTINALQEKVYELQSALQQYEPVESE